MLATHRSDVNQQQPTNAVTPQTCQRLTATTSTRYAYRYNPSRSHTHALLHKRCAVQAQTYMMVVPALHLHTNENTTADQPAAAAAACSSRTARGGKTQSSQSLQVWCRGNVPRKKGGKEAENYLRGRTAPCGKTVVYESGASPRTRNDASLTVSTFFCRRKRSNQLTPHKHTAAKTVPVLHAADALLLHAGRQNSHKQ